LGLRAWKKHTTQSSHYFLRFKALPLAGKPVVARFDGGQLSSRHGSPIGVHND